MYDMFTTNGITLNFYTSYRSISKFISNQRTIRYMYVTNGFIRNTTSVNRTKVYLSSSNGLCFNFTSLMYHSDVIHLHIDYINQFGVKCTSFNFTSVNFITLAVNFLAFSFQPSSICYQLVQLLNT